MLDQLNIITRREIMPDKIRDNFFLGASALLAYMRAKGMVRDFRGGSQMQTQFLKNGILTDAYAPGDEFTPIRRQLIASTFFEPKFYYGLIVEFLEYLEVFNKGPLAVASLLDIDMGAAVNSMTARLSVMAYLNGQGTRSKHINGFPEALSDGNSPDYQGNTYTSYGGQLRSEVGNALNSTPYFVGGADGSLQQITYKDLIDTYVSCKIGANEPDLGLTTKAVWARILEILENKIQYMAMTKDPYWGTIGGIKFQNALIALDEYCPSAIYGQNAEYGNFSTAGTTSAMPAAGAQYNAIPATFAKVKPAASTTLQVGETFWWLNSGTWLYDMSDSPLYGMGFTGFIPSPVTTRVVGRVHFAGNQRCLEPRLNKALYGIQG